MFTNNDNKHLFGKLLSLSRGGLGCAFREYQLDRFSEGQTFRFQVEGDFSTIRNPFEGHGLVRYVNNIESGTFGSVGFEFISLRKALEEEIGAYVIQYIIDMDVT